MDIEKVLDEIILSLTNENAESIELNDDVDLIVDLGFDSLSVMQCIVEIESKFDIEFDIEELMLENIKSYNWLIKKINALLQGKGDND